jgi:hypothetical protein
VNNSEAKYMFNSVLRFINIILAAILAGTSLGIWLGFNPANLSPAAYVEQQQNMLAALNVLMISLVVIATGITLISAWLQKSDKTIFITLLIAAAFFIACIFISRFGNQPLNNIIMTWTSSSLPENWLEIRDQWWSFHIMRTIAELLALCLITLVSVRKN